MTEEFVAHEKTLKVELHLHLSVAPALAQGFPDLPVGPYQPPRVEPPAKSRGWLSQSFVVLSVTLSAAPP